MEYLEGGNLLDAVRLQRKHRITDQRFKLKAALFDLAVQVANACSYLESMNCIHRDIAARNVLLTSKDLFSAEAKLGKTLTTIFPNDYSLNILTGTLSW